MHLDTEGVAPNNSGLSWSASTNSDFIRYCALWEKENPTFFIYRPYHAKALQLTSFEQQLVYDFEYRKWRASQIATPVTYKVIDKMKDHPMLQNLYISVGVDLHFEVVIAFAEFWFFESASKVLVDGARVEKKEGLNRHQLHAEIVEGIKQTTVEYVDPRVSNTTYLNIHGEKYAHLLK